MQKPGDEKDLLIFDGGDPNGNIHIYEHKETRKARDVRKKMEEHYREAFGVEDLPEDVEEDMIRIWAEDLPGSLLYWDLSSEGL